MSGSSSHGSLVVADGLAREFPGGKTIGPVDLDVGRGTRLALTGPNGSGKSTVLRCLAGTLTPTRGSVWVGGHAAGSLPARSLVGVSLSQERSFDLRLSGHANLLFFARLRCGDTRAAARSVSDMTDELELEEIASKRVSECSTGMTQQLAFARALLGNPAVVLLDEPTRSLDEGARERFWAALYRRPELAVIVATHREDDFEHCQRRIELGD